MNDDDKPIKRPKTRLSAAGYIVPYVIKNRTKKLGVKQKLRLYAYQYVDEQKDFQYNMEKIATAVVEYCVLQGISVINVFKVSQILKVNSKILAYELLQDPRVSVKYTKRGTMNPNFFSVGLQ